jgi:hypothetical protein
MGGGAALATQGRVSGAYPKDKATQQLWTSANIPANSVYVGGKAYPNEPWRNSGGTWQQVSSPGGAGAQAALTGGALVDGAKKGGVTGAALGGLQGAAQIITNQPYLTGVSGAMGAINTPSQAKSFFDQTAGSVVPNFIRDAASATDPLQRQTSVQGIGQSMKNAVTNGIPGLREHNQSQLDVFGNSLQRNNGVLNAALNPLNPQTSHPSALTTAMGTVHNATDVNGKNLSIPSQINKKFTVKDASGKTTALTDAQRTQFIQQSGQAAQKQLNQLIGTPAFQNATPAQQSTMMNNVVSGQRDLTKQSFGNAAKLTAAGKAAKNGTLPSVSSNGKVTNGTSKSDYYSSPAAEYKALLDKYNQSIKNNSYGSQAARITAEKTLAKAQIGSTFDKAIRDAYGLSSKDLYNYVHNDPNGNAIVQQVLNYGDALVNAGIESKNKFKNKYGTVTLGNGNSSSSTSSSGSTRTTSGTRSTGIRKARVASLRVKVPRAPRLSTRQPSFKMRIPKAVGIKAPKATFRAPKMARMPRTTVPRAPRMPRAPSAIPRAPAIKKKAIL